MLNHPRASARCTRGCPAGRDGEGIRRPRAERAPPHRKLILPVTVERRLDSSVSVCAVMLPDLQMLAVRHDGEGAAAWGHAVHLKTWSTRSRRSSTSPCTSPRTGTDAISSWMVSIHIPFQEISVPRGQYARGYRVVRESRVTYITRTRMREHERDAAAVIVHCTRGTNAVVPMRMMQRSEVSETSCSIIVSVVNALPTSLSISMWAPRTVSARGRCVRRSIAGSASRAGGWWRWCRGPSRCRG